MARKRKLGQCALCRAPKVPLCDSHIIPRAIAKWAKSNANKGERKAFWDINNRRLIQDFHRIPMLCECCDNVQFGKREDKFFTHIFKPYQDDMRREFAYNDWLRYYAISQGWRLLHHHLELVEATATEGLEKQLLRHLGSRHTQDVYERWRDYLLGNRSELDTAQYICFFNHYYRLPGVNWGGSAALEAEYGELVDAGPIFSDGRFALLSQTYGILLVCAVSPPEWSELEEEKIGSSGSLTIRAHGRLPALLAQWIWQRMRELQEYVDRTQPKGIRDCLG